MTDKSTIVILPKGLLNERNLKLREWALANGVTIQFVGGDDAYQGSELGHIYIDIDECPEDF